MHDDVIKPHVYLGHVVSVYDSISSWALSWPALPAPALLPSLSAITDASVEKRSLYGSPEYGETTVFYGAPQRVVISLPERVPRKTRSFLFCCASSRLDQDTNCFRSTSSLQILLWITDGLRKSFPTFCSGIHRWRTQGMHGTCTKTQHNI